MMYEVGPRFIDIYARDIKNVRLEQKDQQKAEL